MWEHRKEMFPLKSAFKIHDWFTPTSFWTSASKTRTIRPTFLRAPVFQQYFVLFCVFSSQTLDCSELINYMYSRHYYYVDGSELLEWLARSCSVRSVCQHCLEVVAGSDSEWLSWECVRASRPIIITSFIHAQLISCWTVAGVVGNGKNRAADGKCCAWSTTTPQLEGFRFLLPPESRQKRATERFMSLEDHLIYNQ